MASHCVTGAPASTPSSGLALTCRPHGKGALGHRGWAGPMPVRSHGPHAYVFQLFALDQALDRAPGLPAGFTLDDVLAAIKGHAIGRARLDGTYDR